MKKNMIDILACPIDKNYPLDLYEINCKENTVVEGALFCSKCSRFYPIIEEIPILLPDELRDKKLDLGFLKNNEKTLPEKILNNSLPWHL